MKSLYVLAGLLLATGGAQAWQGGGNDNSNDYTSLPGNTSGSCDVTGCLQSGRNTFYNYGIDEATGYSNVCSFTSAYAYHYLWPPNTYDGAGAGSGGCTTVDPARGVTSNGFVGAGATADKLGTPIVSNQLGWFVDVGVGHASVSGDLFLFQFTPRETQAHASATTGIPTCAEAHLDTPNGDARMGPFCF